MTMAIFPLSGPTNQSRPIANLFNFYVFSTIWMKFSMWTTPTLLFSCPFHAPAPTLLLPGSSFCPASAVLLPCSFQVPIPHIPSSSPVPAQLLPAFYPVLLYSAQLCSCPVPALLLSPTLLMLQPRSCFAPALLLPCSWSCQPQFGSLHHYHQHLTTFFGTMRAAFYGILH